jgi:predicted Fe-S protein YdhL (DUF1289 family)
MDVSFVSASSLVWINVELVACVMMTVCPEIKHIAMVELSMCCGRSNHGTVRWGTENADQRPGVVSAHRSRAPLPRCKDSNGTSVVPLELQHMGTCTLFS